MAVKRRHFLKTDAARQVLAALSSYDTERILTGTLEVIETPRYSLIALNGTPVAMYVDGKPFFTVRGALELKPRKHLVTVDMGAVKFIRNGADVMSPGIVAADESIEPGDPVIVVEERHKKPLGVGTALMNGTEMTRSTKGKAIKMVHHVGDAIWDLAL
ncbi:MAG: RNA-binding protein [Euryarchaeota archaeon]|nr:RNA-binding protein [Euryarchaeota archaeon]